MVIHVLAALMVFSEGTAVDRPQSPVKVGGPRAPTPASEVAKMELCQDDLVSAMEPGEHALVQLGGGS